MISNRVLDGLDAGMRWPLAPPGPQHQRCEMGRRLHRHGQCAPGVGRGSPVAHQRLSRRTRRTGVEEKTVITPISQGVDFFGHRAHTRSAQRQTGHAPDDAEHGQFSGHQQHGRQPCARKRRAPPRKRASTYSPLSYGAGRIPTAISLRRSLRPARSLCLATPFPLGHTAPSAENRTLDSDRDLPPQPGQAWRWTPGHPHTHSSGCGCGHTATP